jgi:hypothetical protein
MFEMKKRVDLSDLSMQEIISALLEHGFKQGVATVKSEDPVDDSVKALKTLVGSDFEKRVIFAENSALVEFYAPWYVWQSRSTLSCCLI